MTKTIDKLAWTPLKDRQVLYARSKKEPVLFYCVWGKREPDESDEQALVREVREEAGVEIILSTIKHMKTFFGPAHGVPPDVKLKMACYYAECEGEPRASSEIAELAWFSSADMQRTTPMGQTILRWFIEQNLID